MITEIIPFQHIFYFGPLAIRNVGIWLIEIVNEQFALLGISLSGGSLGMGQTEKRSNKYLVTCVARHSRR
ncbi:MAG: hypothetical protein AB7I27_16070 [Bacteriovoracaceae bacterium]